MQEAKSAQNQRYRATKREIKLLDDANERASDIVINMEYDQTTLQADIRQLQEDKAALEEQEKEVGLCSNCRALLHPDRQLLTRVAYGCWGTFHGCSKKLPGKPTTSGTTSTKVQLGPPHPI